MHVVNARLVLERHFQLAERSVVQRPESVDPIAHGLDRDLNALGSSWDGATLFSNGADYLLAGDFLKSIFDCWIDKVMDISWVFRNAVVVSGFLKGNDPLRWDVDGDVEQHGDLACSFWL